MPVVSNFIASKCALPSHLDDTAPPQGFDALTRIAAPIENLVGILTESRCRPPGQLLVGTDKRGSNHLKISTRRMLNAPYAPAVAHEGIVKCSGYTVDGSHRHAPGEAPKPLGGGTLTEYRVEQRIEFLAIGESIFKGTKLRMCAKIRPLNQIAQL